MAWQGSDATHHNEAARSFERSRSSAGRDLGIGAGLSSRLLHLDVRRFYPILLIALDFNILLFALNLRTYNIRGPNPTIGRGAGTPCTSTFSTI